MCQKRDITLDRDEIQWQLRIPSLASDMGLVKAESLFPPDLSPPPRARPSVQQNMGIMMFRANGKGKPRCALNPQQAAASPVHRCVHATKPSGNRVRVSSKGIGHVKRCLMRRKAFGDICGISLDDAGSTNGMNGPRKGASFEMMMEKV